MADKQLLDSVRAVEEVLVVGVEGLLEDKSEFNKGGSGTSKESHEETQASSSAGKAKGLKSKSIESSNSLNPESKRLSSGLRQRTMGLQQLKVVIDDSDIKSDDEDNLANNVIRDIMNRVERRYQYLDGSIKSAPVYLSIEEEMKERMSLRRNHIVKSKFIRLKSMQVDTVGEKMGGEGAPLFSSAIEDNSISSLAFSQEKAGARERDSWNKKPNLAKKGSNQPPELKANNSDKVASLL